ncbi:MAG: PEP-CTERM sorting domain-containing protein [Planctomycetota bacterium]
MHRNARLVTALTLAPACAVAWPAPHALAHDGRRFQIEVSDTGQLRAQGVNTQDAVIAPMGTPINIDPAGYRAYRNANHGHWTNPDGVTTLVPGSTLPGYDMGAGAQALAGHDVTWTFQAAYKWSNVSAVLVPNPDFALPMLPAFVPDGTVPVFEPLAAEEEIQLGFINPETLVFSSLSTDTPGASIQLIDDFDGAVSFDPSGFANTVGSDGYDLDLIYAYFHDQDALPADTLYVIESTLSTDAPGIADSATVYTILSPDGANPVTRLHFASLYLEAFLGSYLDADANQDGSVDLLDFDVLAGNFGSATTGGATEGDFNADGIVDLLDFDLLANGFGDAIGPAGLPANVPEPASIALLTVGIAAARRRRRQIAR